MKLDKKEVALQKEFVSLQAKGDKLTDAEKKAFEKKSQDFQSFLDSASDRLNKEQMAKLKRIEDVYVKALKKSSSRRKIWLYIWSWCIKSWWRRYNWQSFKTNGSIKNNKNYEEEELWNIR